MVDSMQFTLYERAKKQNHKIIYTNIEKTTIHIPIYSDQKEINGCQVGGEGSNSRKRLQNIIKWKLEGVMNEYVHYPDCSDGCTVYRYRKIYQIVYIIAQWIVPQ